MGRKWKSVSLLPWGNCGKMVTLILFDNQDNTGASVSLKLMYVEETTFFTSK